MRELTLFSRLADGEVHIWKTGLDRCSQDLDQRARLLSADERARASRYRLPDIRSRFTTARAMLRSVLGAYCGVSPHTLEFDYQTHGKPRLCRMRVFPSVAFNLSHSADLVMLAVTGGCDVGVDVEWMRPDRDVVALANRFFAPAEAAQLRGYPPGQRERAFYACWTRKEAVLKACGAGLSLPLSSFCVTVDPSGPVRLLSARWEYGRVSLWQLRDVRADSGYRAALAVRGRIQRLRYFHWPETEVGGGGSPLADGE